MSDFPDYCIRGIREGKHISNDGMVLATLFIPDDRTSDKRKDKGAETSINWQDDDQAVSFTLNQRDTNKGGNYLFPNGAIKIPKNEMQHINLLESTRDTIFYERAPLPDNKYHGNIVFKFGVSKPRMTLIASVLAASASPVLKRDVIKNR